MSIRQIFRNIWNNAVWSKVISAGIVGVIGIVIAIINWTKILNCGVIIFVYAKNHYEWAIIILLSIILIAMLLKRISKRPKPKKTNIRWFKKNIENIISENIFLIWFPINGVLYSSFADLSTEDRLKVVNSRKIVSLLEKNIISIEFYSINIDKRIFDILDNSLNKDYDKNKPRDREAIKEIQNIRFSELIFNCAISTKYDP